MRVGLGPGPLPPRVSQPGAAAVGSAGTLGSSVVVLTINLCWFLPPLLLRLSPLAGGGAPPASLTSFSPVHLSRSPWYLQISQHPLSATGNAWAGPGCLFPLSRTVRLRPLPPEEPGLGWAGSCLPITVPRCFPPLGWALPGSRSVRDPLPWCGGCRGALCCPGKLQRSSAVCPSTGVCPGVGFWLQLPRDTRSQGPRAVGAPRLPLWHLVRVLWGASGSPSPWSCSVPPVPPNQELPLCWSRPPLAELPLSPAQTSSQAGEQHTAPFSWESLGTVLVFTVVFLTTVS